MGESGRGEREEEGEQDRERERVCMYVKERRKMMGVTRGPSLEEHAHSPNKQWAVAEAVAVVSTVAKGRP